MGSVIVYTLLKTFTKVDTRQVISCGMAVIFWRTASLSCSIDWGQLLHIFDLRYPQRKKSHGFKSGEQAGQPMSPRNEMKWPANISLKIPIAHREVYYIKKKIKKRHYMYFSKIKTLLFLYFICLLLNLQMCQIILPDPVYIKYIWFLNTFCR